MISCTVHKIVFETGTKTQQAKAPKERDIVSVSSVSGEAIDADLAIAEGPKGGKVVPDWTCDLPSDSSMDPSVGDCREGYITVYDVVYRRSASTKGKAWTVLYWLQPANGVMFYTASRGQVSRGGGA